MIPAGPDNKKARKKAGNKHEGNSNVGDERKYHWLGLAACDAVAAAPLISWGMNPLSGQAIIWCTIQDSNLKPIA